MSARLVAAAFGGSLVLAGCTTLGGNIKGSFACSAPDGICAPSALIDDRALAMISGTAEVVPAGPYTPAKDAIGGVRVAGGAGVARTNQKVLKIVFPAHVDRQGRYHETAAIRAVVDNGAWLAEAKAADPTPVAALQEVAVNDAAVPGPLRVDISTAVSQAPALEDAATAVPITREGLQAEVAQLLANPAPVSSKVTPAVGAVAPESAAPSKVPEQQVKLTLPAAAAVAAPPAVNRPASFRGIVEE
ncbi:MAG: conjugal transfer protein [Jiangellaceae bacterium]